MTKKTAQIKTEDRERDHSEEQLQEEREAPSQGNVVPIGAAYLYGETREIKTIVN